jgi:hypothetical protein
MRHTHVAATNPKFNTVKEENKDVVLATLFSAEETATLREI